MKKILLSVPSLIIILLICSAQPVFSSSLEEKKYDIGISVGPWFSGGDVNFDNDPINIDRTKKRPV
jgi:hypothetical protein